MILDLKKRKSFHVFARSQGLVGRLACTPLKGGSVHIQMVELQPELERPTRCPACRGTGVVRPKDGLISSDAGVFCLDCKEGRDRWQATLKSIADYERPSVVRATSLKQRQTRVFVQ